MRLFLAVWPSVEVVEALRALPRPQTPGVRWSTEDQWHVTVEFLGECELADGRTALDRVTAPAATAVLGPATARLGRHVLVVPVEGLDALVERAHITVARARRGMPAEVAGQPVAPVAWRVDEVTLVESRLRPEGARYEVLERRTLVR